MSVMVSANGLPRKSSTPPTGMWEQHWGVLAENYSTAGSVTLTVRDDMRSGMYFSTGGGTWKYTVYGVTGVITTVTGITTATTSVFNPLSFSNSFPAVNGQQYGVFIIKVEPTTPSLLCNYFAKGYDTTTQQDGILYIHTNIQYTSSGVYMFSGDTIAHNMNIEGVKITQTLDAANNEMFRNYFGKYVDLGPGFSDTNTSCYNLFYQASCLEEVYNHFKGHSSYLQYYYQCYQLRVCDINGTYPYATTMQSMLYGNYSRDQAINIVAPNLTNFSGNDFCYQVPSVSIDAPLQSFSMQYAYNMADLSLENTNFRNAPNGTVFNVTNCKTLDCTSIIAQIAANEASGSLLGKVFVITGTLNSATVDITPITNLGGTVNR